MRIPSATYRFQINDDFTLDDAHAAVPYVAALGVTDLYLSPIFEARPGSLHGYDVTDPTRVRSSIGSMDALRRLAAEARQHDMGIVLDIVPNHMAASPLNPWWRGVLAEGRQSAYAAYFDIDWDSRESPQRLRLPILGDPLDAVIERDEIDIDIDAGELVYFETRLPLASDSVGADGELLHGADRKSAIRRILDRQHYRLDFWRTASESMNYRRFFDITDLAGVRVEVEDVFEATHVLIRELAADGTVTGLRIDHIDGLRDPTGYLELLRERVRGPDGGPVYTIVEKILEREERVPAEWACEGTTGYEFLNLATGLLIHPGGYDELRGFYQRMTGDTKRFGELVREKKLLVIGRLFGSELKALGTGLARLEGLEPDAARLAVAEATASMGVYRTYIRGDTVRSDDRRRVEAAVRDASRRNPDLSAALDALRSVVLEHPDDDRLDWVMRWQQFTGPVMAKGFEDTALYCHNALLAANEVGSDPVRPALTAHELHGALRLRHEQSRHSLNATATHDTKRGEDTRARIAVLSEVAGEWRRQLRRWMREGEEWKADLAEDEDTTVPEADVDSLLYQTLVGAWPLDGADAAYTERVQAYMTKAVREAKEQTSWRRPDEDYEQALSSFIDLLMQEVGRPGLAEDVGSFAQRIAPHGALNSLTQLLLKVTAPGIPDIYQGTELWSFTLVDPDNRQPVDYEERRTLLHGLEPLLECPEAGAVRALLDGWQDGRIKLLVTALALRCRRRHYELFRDGALLPLEAHGDRADYIMAFARSDGSNACIVVLPRWSALLAPQGWPGDEAWGDTSITLPPQLHGAWRNALAGEATEDSGRLRVADLFRRVPLALLESA
jgi:(1->4)-alpha-D-glucan 1-alpha-D-glucosylmutase